MLDVVVVDMGWWGRALVTLMSKRPKLRVVKEGMELRNPAGMLLLLVSLLAACNSGPEAAATIKKYRPGVEARLATIKQIGDQLKGMPALSRDAVALDSGPVKLGNGLGKPEASDTAVMEEESRLGNPVVDPGYSVGTKDLWWCARLLGGQANAMSSEEAEARLGLCANAKYLLIVRTLETTFPKVEEGKGTFQPGSASGEVRVFNLTSSKDLGGFRFKARNSDLVTARDGAGRDYSAVSSDLKSQISKQVTAGIAKHMSGN